MITLQQFFESKKSLAIHCDTEEKAQKLCEAFDKMGKKWRLGQSYLEDNAWRKYKKDTCYTNNGFFYEKRWLLLDGFKIYEFEEVDLRPSLKPILEKTCIVYNDSVLTFDGNIKPSDNQNCVIEQGIDEVVDMTLVHTYYINKN